jgi:hypothetical protein
MLIVGGALALTAIGVFLIYRFIVRCRALWRKRKTRVATREKATERIGVE